MPGPNPRVGRLTPTVTSGLDGWSPSRSSSRYRTRPTGLLGRRLQMVPRARRPVLKWGDFGGVDRTCMVLTLHVDPWNDGVRDVDTEFLPTNATVDPFTASARWGVISNPPWPWTSRIIFVDGVCRVDRGESTVSMKSRPPMVPSAGLLPEPSFAVKKMPGLKGVL